MTHVEKVEMEIKEEQRILAANAWHLARFLIEHDHEIDLPKGFNSGQFLSWCEQYPQLDGDRKINFINQYANLEKAAKNVTARTLVATRIHGHGFFHAAVFTSVGQFLVFLFLMTGIFTGLLFYKFALGQNTFHEAFTPFFAAGVGTCVYLLRVTQERLKTRTFDPAYVPSQLIRLGLGVLAGGSIVLFPGLFDFVQAGVEGANPDARIATQSLVAFVLGYAVDIYYALLDNIGGRIKSASNY